MRMTPQGNAPEMRRLFAVVIVTIGLTGAIVLATQLLKKPAPRMVAEPPDSLAAANAEGYLMGNPNAPVQVVEFADFECPTCAQFATGVEPEIRTKLIATGQVAIRFYDFPLPIHKNTWAASIAAACANDQGKFFEMHDRLFISQSDWNSRATGAPKLEFKKYVAAIGLDIAKWEACFDKRAHIATIKGNMAEGLRRGVDGTPTFFIGDKNIAGSPPYDTFKQMVDEALAAKGAAPGAAKAPAVPPAH
jgi:protein-disulfide isomerase